MDYKQINEGDFESAKAWYKIVKEQNNQLAIEILERLFPSLKESEDERIKKNIISWLKNIEGQTIPVDEYNSALAWLEKQGKRNTNLCQEDGAVEMYAVTEPEKYCKGVSAPIEATAATYTTEVETGDGGIKALVTGKVVIPKFKVGDWIANDYCIGKVIALTDDAYLLDTGQGIPFSCEHNVHLWTIADAKDGDVLQLGLVTAIFKNFIGNGCCTCYCSVWNGEFEIPRQDSSYGCHNATPATKEQRDQLERDMTNAGYRWNKEELKLEKI